MNQNTPVYVIMIKKDDSIDDQTDAHDIYVDGLDDHDDYGSENPQSCKRPAKKVSQ